MPHNKPTTGTLKCRIYRVLGEYSHARKRHKRCTADDGQHAADRMLLTDGWRVSKQAACDGQRATDGLTPRSKRAAREARAPLSADSTPGGALLFLSGPRTAQRNRGTHTAPTPTVRQTAQRGPHTDSSSEYGRLSSASSRDADSIATSNSASTPDDATFLSAA